LLPLRAMPPGNGVIMPGSSASASAARRAAASAPMWVRPWKIRLPPAILAERKLLFAVGQAVVHGGRRAGHEALAGAIRDGFGERVGGEAEREQRHAGPAVGRFRGRQPALDADLGIARDHAARVACEGADRGVEPVVVVRGDDQPRVAHPKRFGERVDDLRFTDLQRRTLHASRCERTTNHGGTSSSS
jgi:hypothetical protein